MLPSPLLLTLGGLPGKRVLAVREGAAETSPLRSGAQGQPAAHLEQRHILSQELGQVDVQQGPEQQDALVLLGVLELEVAGGGEHRLDSAHAVVIVVLRGELLRAQAVGGHDLLGEAGT